MKLAKHVAILIVLLGLAGCIDVDGVGLRVTFKKSPGSELDFNTCGQATLSCVPSADASKPTYFWATVPANPTPKGPL